MNQKKNQFVTATTISKRANANLGIKISRHTISWRLNEINLKSQVTSSKSYISKKNKTSRLKFATEHIIWTEEQRDYSHFSNKFNLFSCDRRRSVQRSSKEWYSTQCTKSSVKFGGGSVMVFGMIYATATGTLVRLHSKLMQLYTKRYWRNMYLIWELQLINQLYLSKITLCVTLWSLLRHFFLGRMLLLWSGLLKAQKWILLRMFGSY